MSIKVGLHLLNFRVVILILLLGFSVIASYYLFEGRAVEVEAAAPFRVQGYAWASTDVGGQTTSTGMGWISFEGTNYGVQIDSNRLMNGYAWIGGNTDFLGNPITGGWVNFNNNGCPAADVDGLNCQPQIISDGSSGWEMLGWARACAVFSNPIGCTGALKPAAELGGWDGWISLNCRNTNSCAAVPYAIRIDSTGAFITTTTDASGSFAWGHDVLGWINIGADARIIGLCGNTTNKCIDPVTSEATVEDIWCGTTVTPTNCSLTGEICGASGQCEPVTTPTVTTFTVQPLIIRKGGSVTVTWDVVGAASCVVASNGTAVSTGPLQGSVSVNNIQSSRTTISLTCDGTLLDSKLVRTTAVIYE